MKRVYYYWLVASLLLLPCEAFGQFVWQITRPPDTGLYANSMLWGLSCKGRNCTACGLAGDGYQVLIFQSTDAGRSWSTYDPGIWSGGAANNSTLTHAYQIDSLNAVAIGTYRTAGQYDSAITLRTTNAGKTWELQPCTPDTSTKFFQAVHFSDSANGIQVGGFNDFVILTSDGGNHWNTTPFHRTQQWFGFNACHAYGEGRYAAFCGSSVANKVFITTDAWNTVDSGATLPDSIVRFGRKCVSLVDRCLFGSSGLVIAYGAFRAPDTFQIIGKDTFRVSRADTCMLFRSTDYGKTWSKPIIMDSLGGIGPFTLLDNDSIFANAGYSDGHHQFSPILLSTDKGISWKSFPFNAPSAWGTIKGIEIITNLQLATNADIVATVSQPLLSHSVLMHGSIQQLQVRQPSIRNRTGSVYPNPASTTITVSGLADNSKYSITDDLGREVMQGTQKANGEVSVSNLPDGVYFVHTSSGDVFQVVVTH